MGIEYSVVLECPFCIGTGLRRGSAGDGIVENECGACSGTGRLRHGKLVHPDGVYPAYLVFEATDKEEYDGLNAAKQRDYVTVLSCGLVDLNSGSNARAFLGGLFDSNTQTYANLMELIS